MRAAVLPTPALVLLLAATAAGFEAPQGAWQPRSYAVMRAEIAPRVDGNLDDTCWQNAPWTEDFTDIEGDARPVPRFDTRAKLLWDDAALYVGAWLEDTDVWGRLVDRDAVIYQDNDFEVFLDPDGDNHLYWELEVNALNTVWDLLLVRPYRDGGPAIDAFDTPGLETAVLVSGTVNVPGDQDRGWSVEIRIPWEALKQLALTVSCPPAAGDWWRANLSRVQWRHEVEGGRYVKTTPVASGLQGEDNWVWSPQGLIAMHYPERWGFLIFSDQAAVEAVQPPQMGIPAAAVPGDRYLMPLYYAQRRYHEREDRYAGDLELIDLPADVLEWLHERQDRARFALLATPWQFEARVNWNETTYHVDHTGRLWTGE